jgi:hypothetical protein
VPIQAYYKGKGRKVMRDMQARYGDEGGKRVFYATARKRGLERPGKKRSSPRG